MADEFRSTHMTGGDKIDMNPTVALVAPDVSMLGRSETTPKAKAQAPLVSAGKKHS